ncbi:MAG: DUF4194 domain-containing protein [Gammaproteobacteria bacterium]|nr:DUF4194 domain-containing protein [Gammaproteobacteria bacterium]
MNPRDELTAQEDGGAPALFDALRGGEGEDCTPLATQEAAKDDKADGAPPPHAGRLAPDARRALVVLLKQGLILASEKRLLYESLCRYRKPIDAHLADMYLRMLIDERAGLALILQHSADDGVSDDRVSDDRVNDNTGDDEAEDFCALITRRPLSLYDTLLLLVLRKHYQERQTDGANIVHIDVEHIEARLSPFLPLTTSSRNERKRLSGALGKMVERKLLARVRGDDERFKITPVITYVVNAPALEHWLTQYEQLLEASGPDDGPSGDVHPGTGSADDGQEA